MKRIFISSVQKEFERERAAIKKMVETDPIIKPYFKAFVFEIDAPATDKTTQQVYLDEIARSDVYLVLIGNKYGYCKDGERSPTEQEYDKAAELGLPKLIMVRGSDNSKREVREAAFLDKISANHVRIRFQDDSAGNPTADLLDEVRNSLRDIMIDEGILSEIPFEDQSPADVSLEDISEERIRWFVDSAVRNRKANYKQETTKEDVLRTLHLLNRKTGLPTNAGVLLFGKDVQYFFQSSQIKCVCYAGVEKGKPTSDVLLLEGDLFQLADQAVSYIGAHLDNGAGEHRIGAAADDVMEIPNAVIAEAVNNAIAHRNYSNVASIQIEVYRNRVEIINPGRLHPSLTIADLYKKHESFPPNARIAHAMYQVKYIEALGTGLTDLLRNCRETGLKKPVFEEVSGRFRIVIWRKENGNKLEITKAKLLELVKKSGEFSLIEYANACECDNKTIKRAIESLKKSGVVRHVGSKKYGHWEVIPLEERG